MVRCSVPGFCTAYNRHTRSWGWRERKPSMHPLHITRESGFETQSDAVASIRAEILRRERLAGGSKPRDLGATG